MKINITDVDINVAKKIAYEKALKNLCVPIRETKDEVYIATSNLIQPYAREIEFIFSKKAKFIEVEENLITNLINNIFISNEKNFEKLIIFDSINSKASDIHFEPNEDSVLVRIRIDGTLKIRNLLTRDEYSKLLSKIKVQSNLDITEKRKPQDGKLTIYYNDLSYDLRVSIINTIHGEKLVLRILYGKVFNYTLEKLNLSIVQRENLNKIIQVNNGVVIITGPTGSGKSTTLYTILQAINSQEVNIMTLEDPVEVEIIGVNQITLNRAINMDFATGLRSIIRQDPDIIMVGEIRDAETAEIVSRAGITGHKVYSTIHTNDPREVYFRFEEMGVKGYLIRDSLVGIISQRLVKVLCENCKTQNGVGKIKELEFVKFKAEGCETCSYTGYSGRELVAAIHHIDKSIKSKLKNIYNDFSLLTNEEMLLNIERLFIIGRITETDFINFIDSEELKSSYEKI